MTRRGRARRERSPGRHATTLVDRSWPTSCGTASERPGAWHDPQVTTEPVSAQRLSDLARLRRVRDRIDREYAKPLDVEALARDAHMSAGHFSRQSGSRTASLRTPTS